MSLRTRIECAKSTGELPKDADPAALARYIVAVSNGMCVQAASGATRDELHQTVDLALAAFPKPAERTVRRKSGARSEVHQH